MYLSVIIPAYNEEKKIEETLRDVDQYLKRQSYQSEIIVVENGSKDRTPEIVKDLMPEIKNLQMVKGKENTGKGYAVRKGMASAKGDFCVFTDADNSTTVDQVEKMWPEFKNGFEVL